MATLASTLVLRTTKGTPLTFVELDSNFSELRSDIALVNTDITNHAGSGGTTHALATTEVNGFMSKDDKANLDDIIAGNVTTSISVANDTATATALYPVFVADGPVTNVINTTTSKLSFIPETGQLNSVSFNSTSDERLKSNIQQIVGALDTVCALQGKTYTITDQNTNSAGVIAQQLQYILPNLVNDRGDGYLSVTYDAIIPYLIEAIKELKNKIDDINSK